MARTSKRVVLVDRQDPSQPPLFDDRQYPAELGALESVRTRRYECKGVRLVDDDTKALRLVELLCLKWGVKKISREMNISPHTVRAARRLLAAQGKLAPYVQRVTEVMEDAIEAGMTQYRDALEDGLVSAGQIPVGIGIIFDKRALAKGEPTSIRGGVDAQADELKVEALNAYLEQLPSANPPAEGVAVDSSSTGDVAKPPAKWGHS